MDLITMLRYPDMENKLTFADIQWQISSYLYWNYYTTLPKIDKGNKLEDDRNGGCPLMNVPFYSLLKHYHKIPHWEVYMKRYIDLYCTRKNPDRFGNDMVFNERAKKESKKGYLFNFSFSEKYLRGKLIRAYMSFLKEVYILYWLWDKGLKSAYWSVEKDSGRGGGFDIVLFNNKGMEYGIRIFANTDNANRFADMKSDYRHDPGKNIIQIDMVVGSGHMCGDTYVFHEDIMNGVYKYIMSGACKNIRIEKKEDILNG